VAEATAGKSMFFAASVLTDLS